MKKPHKRKLGLNPLRDAASLRAEIPNPVVVQAIQDSVTAFADHVKLDTSKPGMAMLREILPSSLLMQIPPGATAEVTLEDGTKLAVRGVDVRAAGFAMFMKTFMRLSADAILGAEDKMAAARQFDIKTSLPPLRAEPKWGVAVYDDASGARVEWLDLDDGLIEGRESRPSVFATRDDAEAEAESQDFLAAQENYGRTYKAEIIPIALLAPATPPAGGGKPSERRRGRRKGTKKRPGRLK